MSAAPTGYVVDASVGVKLLLPEEHSLHVQELFETALRDGGSSLHVPDLFFVECANVLWKKVRRGEHPQSLAVQNLARLRALGLPTTPTSQLVDRALELACVHGTTVYDACYVALAERLDLPLLTADSRLVGLLSNAGIKTATLGGGQRITE